jgi:glycosidase
VALKRRATLDDVTGVSLDRIASDGFEWVWMLGVGSAFAVADYVVYRDFGGPAALERFRKRLAERGIRLMLDFVPNHTAIDHAWARQHRGGPRPGAPQRIGRARVPAGHETKDPW